MSVGRRIVPYAARPINAVVRALRRSPRLGRFVRAHLTILTYTGRRSGRTVSTPVAYRRNGDTVVITVELPDAKTWWRNFTGTGAPLTLELDGVPRRGHGVARRGHNGQVSVTVRLASASD